LKTFDKFTALTFLFIVVVCLYKPLKFAYPDFIFTYPFISYDGFQWITDSLHYLDPIIEITHRNPALPLTFAVLKLAGQVDLYPWILAFIMIGFFASSYWLLIEFVSRKVANITILAFFFVFRIHNFFDYVLADPWCLLFITIGMGSLVRANRSSKYLYGAAVAFGVSLNYQYAAAFAAPAFIWFLFSSFGVEKIWRKRTTIIACTLIFIPLFSAQFGYKWWYGHYSKVNHSAMLQFHFFGIPFYTLNFFAFLGWPLACMVLFGFYRSICDRAPKMKMVHLYLLCMTIFWVFIYIWLDVRFFLYFLPAWMIYVGIAIDGLKIADGWHALGGLRARRLLTVIFLIFGISVSSEQFGAFEADALPIMPTVNMRFGRALVPGSDTERLNPTSFAVEIRKNPERTLDLFSYFEFYRYPRRATLQYSPELLIDIKKIGSYLRENTLNSERIGLCGDLIKIFENKMRVLDTIARNVDDCREDDSYSILLPQDLKNRPDLTRDRILIYQGQELTLAGPKS
jgi:hypothetical protein